MPDELHSRHLLVRVAEIAAIIALIAALNETRKGLLLNWSYRFNTVAEIISMTFIFIGILFFLGNGELQQDRMAGALIVVECREPVHV